MTERTIKLDASSLIYLTKAGILDLLNDLYQEVIITGAVYQEAVIEGKRRGYPDAFAIERAVADGRVRVLQLGPVARERLVKAGFPGRLGVGEQETIVEAREQGCPAVLDDLHARATAAALQVPLCGSDTLLLEGLLKKRIDGREYEEKITRLAAAMRLRADDLAELLWLGRLVQEQVNRGSN